VLMFVESQRVHI